MKKSLEEIRNEVTTATNKKYNVIKDRYVYTKKSKRREILVKHLSCGNEYWTTKYKVVDEGRRCLFCSKSRPTYNTKIFYEKVKELTNGEYELVGEYVKTHQKIKMLHKKCGDIFEVTPSHFISDGTRCVKCLYDSMRIENYQKRLDKMGNKKFILTSEYINYHSEVIIKHVSCERKFTTKPVDLRRQFLDYGELACPFCDAKTFRGEENINNILLENNTIFRREYRDSRCKNKRTLKFDFAVFSKEGDLKGLIEFDGEQHYIRGKLFSETSKKFKDTQLRDDIKNKFSRDYNIPLLRINYSYVKKEKMRPLIEDFLSKLEL